MLHYQKQSNDGDDMNSIDLVKQECECLNSIDEKFNYLKEKAEEFSKKQQWQDSSDVIDHIFLIMGSNLTQYDNYIYHQFAGINSAMMGHFNKAELSLLKALRFLDKEKDLDAYINLMINIANVEASLGRTHDAIERNLELLTPLSQMEDQHLLGKVYHNLGGFYSRFKDRKNALYYSRLSLKIRSLTKDVSSIGMTLNNISNNYREIGDMSLAMAYMKRALKLIENTQDHYLLSLIYRNLASLYKIKDQLDLAYDYYQKSLHLCEKLNFKQGIMQNVQELAGISSSKNDFDNAEKQYLTAFELSPVIEDSEIIARLYLDFASFKFKVKDFETSAQYFKKAHEIKDKMFSINLSAEAKRLQSEFEFEQKKRESELLKQKNEALIFSYQEMEQQKKELIETNKSKDSILIIVSHDLKNLLGGIKTASRYILDQKKDFNNEITEMIYETSTQALDLVNSILETSKIQMPDFKLNLVATNLNDFIEHYEDSLYFQAKHKKLLVSIEKHPDPLMVNINFEKFWQILFNLTSNACKFSFPESEIKIITQKRDDFAELMICDQGIGIPADAIQKVFDPFTKASRKGTKGESSTGLGLSIVKRLTDLHYGQIIVQSEINKGSTFSVLLPLIK